MAVIGINYTGGNTYDDDGNVVLNDLIYESVYIHSRKGDIVFDSGDFIKDWYHAIKEYIDNSDNDPYLSHSSSVNHFFFDGAEYVSAYLHGKDEDWELLYVDEGDDNYLYSQRHIFEEGMEFFVPEGKKLTWFELKTYCKDYDERNKKLEGVV